MSNKEGDQFRDKYITRKRKLYKFANFNSFENCFLYATGEDPATLAAQLLERLKLGDSQFVLELAAGNAQFSLELARRHPDITYLAVDIKSDRLYTSAKQALVERIDNITFLRTHIRSITDFVPESSVNQLWVTFPDPFPKKGSAKHRLVHKEFLKMYEKMLRPNGVLRFKTDNQQLFRWGLEQLVQDGWRLRELTFDLHESMLPDEYKIMTHYEERYTTEGLPIGYCSATK